MVYQSISGKAAAVIHKAQGVDERSGERHRSAIRFQVSLLAASPVAFAISSQSAACLRNSSHGFIGDQASAGNRSTCPSAQR
jgi:hypothetical protein